MSNPPVLGRVDFTPLESTEQAQDRLIERSAERVPCIIHVFDLDFQRCVYINRPVGSTIGYSPQEIEEMGDRVVSMLMHPDDFAKFPSHIEKLRLLRDGETADFDYRMRDRAGHWHWFHGCDAVFTRNDAGAVRQIIGTAIEITDGKRPELNRDHLRGEILAQVSDAVGMIDNDERITYLNPACERLYRVQHGEMIGRKLSELYQRRWLKPEDEALGLATLHERGEARWELIHIARDGRELQVQSSVCLMRDAAGNITGIIAAIRDIAAQRVAEEKLRTAEAEFRAVFEQSPVGKAQLCAKTGRFIRVNAKYCELIGYSADELAVMTPADLTFADDRDSDSATLGRLLGNKAATYEVEKRYVRKDGKIIWVHVNATLLRNAEGDPERTMAVIQDITARKDTEAQLSASEEFTRTVLESSPDCVKVLDGDGRIEFMNANGACLMEIDDVSKIRGQLWLKLWPEAGQAAVRDAVEAASHGETVRLQMFAPTAKGTPKWWDVVVAPVPGKNSSNRARSIISVSRDVTSQHADEQKLRESQDRLALGTEVAGLALAEVDYATGLNHLSSRAARLFGLGEEATAVPRAAVHATFHPDDRPELTRRIAECLDPAGTGWFAMEHRVIWPNGEERWLSVRKQVFFTGEGAARRPARAVIAALDITAEKNAAKAVRESEERFRVLATAMPQLVWSCSSRGECTFQGPQWETTTGQSCADSLGYGWLDMIHPDDRQRASDLWETAVAQSRTFETEYRLRTKTGAYRWFLSRADAVKDSLDVVQYWIGTSTDIEEAKRNETSAKENEQRMRLATQATEVGIWEWNVVTNSIRWDAQMFRIYGLAPTADGLVQYSDWSGAVLPEELAENERILQETVRRQGHGRRQFRIRRRNDAEVRDIEAVETVRIDEQGQAQWVIGTNLDVTDRKRAEEAVRHSEERYRAAIAAVSDVIWTNNANGFMEGEQRGWGEFTGQTREAYQGYGWTKAIHFEDVQPTIEAWTLAVATKNTFVFEHRVRRRDGEWRTCSIRAVPVLNAEGSIREWVGVHTDITERRAAEQKIKKFNEHLERLVSERTAQAEQRALQLKGLALQLTDAEQKERQRIAMILHDHVQQLLVASRFHIDILRRKTIESSHRESLTKVDTLLNESLVASRNLAIDLSPPILHDGSMAQILAWLGQWFGEKHGLAVELNVHDDARPLSREVRALLFNVVREVLFNVVKHAKTDRADVELSTTRDGRVKVAIADQGVGFDPSQPRSDKSAGSGLGLFSIRERLNWADGTLEIESAPGKGTRTTILAPITLMSSVAENRGSETNETDSR